MHGMSLSQQVELNGKAREHKFWIWQETAHLLLSSIPRTRSNFRSNMNESSAKKEPILRWSIGTKLIIAFLALAIIPMSVTSYYNLTHGQDEVIKNTRENLMGLSKYKGDRLLFEELGEFQNAQNCKRISRRFCLSHH